MRINNTAGPPSNTTIKTHHWMQRLLQMVVQGFLGEMALFTQQTVENSRTFKVRSQEFDQLSEPNRSHPLKPQLSQTFHYFSVCQRWNYCTSLKRMSYLISLHSYTRTTRRFQMNPGFCSSRLLHGTLFMWDFGLLQEFNNCVFLHFINPLGCLKVPHLTLPPWQVRLALPAAGRLRVCVWAAFKHEHNSEVTAGLRRNRAKHKRRSSHTYDMDTQNRSVGPSTICCLCCCCWRIWRRWVNETP